MAKTLGILLTLLFLSSTIIVAQDDEYKTSPETSKDKKSADKSGKKGPSIDWSRVSVGGGLGLQFGSVTYINISPTVAYNITEDFSVGMSAAYLYYSEPRYNFKTYVYGWGPFARHLVYDQGFIHIEYQVLNSEYRLVDNNNRELSRFRQDVHYLWVGGGYMQELGGNTHLMIMALWDLNQDPLSVFPRNPIFRMGIMVGL